MTKYYFDYNSTSPLASSVMMRLQKGEVNFFNPSSLHHLGRKSKKVFNTTSSYLLDTFGVSDSHDIFFHSGTTEGVNTINYSFVKSNSKPLMIAYTTDHTCVRNTLDNLKVQNVDCDTVYLSPNNSGEFDKEKLVKVLEANKGRNILLNWTWSHNETGVVWALDLLKELREEYKFSIHVDAAQVVGKIEAWNVIPSFFDYVTFSGHKFGAMKGVGFSFVLKGSNFIPLLTGGGQQDNYRSGTVNALGIVSLRDAIEENILELKNYSNILKAKQKIESGIIDCIESHGEIVGLKAKLRNNNTIFVVLNDTASDRSLPLFDIEKVAVGTGAACSSGTKKASSTLEILGFNDKASNGIRFSFIPSTLLTQGDEYSSVIQKILKKIIND